MKLSTLSAVAALVLSTSSVSALTLYQDPATGQVFTKGGEGRVEMGDFVDAKTVYSENEAQDVKIEEVEKQASAPSKGNGITILDKKSPEFLLGQETHINMKFVPEDAPDMWLKAGVRIQGSFEGVDTDYNDVLKSDESTQDAYLRRVRFEIAAGFGKHASFVMDVRNDKANFQDEGENEFNVGDAYVKIKKPFDTSLLNFKLYRAKIDISRTETVKSARVIAYDRPKIADQAAQYITHNRRGTNVQAYGDWEKKIHYQIASGDGVHSGKLADAKGRKDASVDESSLFYGGKIRISPFDGWEETKRTETYMGEGKHFSVGAAYWAVPQIKGTNTTGQKFDLNNELINLEASAHYNGLFVQAEYFKFKDTVRDWNSGTDVDTGDSDGYYVTSEYVMKDFYYIAPFIRYEDWDRFSDEDGYDYEATTAGINWYLRGNTTKVGLYYQTEDYGKNIGDKDVDTIRVTSQWFF